MLHAIKKIQIFCLLTILTFSFNMQASSLKSFTCSRHIQDALYASLNNPLYRRLFKQEDCAKARWDAYQRATCCLERISQKRRFLFFTCNSEKKELLRQAYDCMRVMCACIVKNKDNENLFSHIMQTTDKNNTILFQAIQVTNIEERNHIKMFTYIINEIKKTTPFAQLKLRHIEAINCFLFFFNNINILDCITKKA